MIYPSNPNRNYTPWGQLWVWRPTHGTLTLVQPEEPKVKNTGNCFSISTTFPECFKLSVEEGECFSITDRVNEEEEVPEIDLGHLNLRKIILDVFIVN